MDEDNEKLEERDWEAFWNQRNDKNEWIDPTVELANKWEFTDKDGAPLTEWIWPYRSWTPEGSEEEVNWEIRKSPKWGPDCKQVKSKVEDPDSTWLNPLPDIEEKQWDLNIYRESSWSIRKKIPPYAETYENDYHYVPSMSDISVYWVATTGTDFRGNL